MGKNGTRLGIYGDSDLDKFVSDLNSNIFKDLNKEVVFFCIGTDRSTGDSLGPIVGTMLEEMGYTNVIGTLDNPVHASNLQEKIDQIPDDTIVIAIDSSLGRSGNVEKIVFNEGKIHPGSALGKNLPPVGDYNISCIVNVSGFMEYQLLMTTRLSVVVRLAKNVVNSIKEVFPLNDNN